MKRIAAAIAAAGLAAVLAAPAHAVILTNGSFEDTTGFVANGSDYMVLFGGSTTMFNWTVTANQLAWIGPSNPFGLTASQGSYFLDLTSDTDNGLYGGVTQPISTVMGGKYRLSFDLGGSTTFGVPDSIKACAGTTCQVSLITATGTNDWVHETLDFTATGTSTAISLDGASGKKYIGLDNVFVTAVPLPNSLVLLGTGLLAAVAVLFRRRKTTYQHPLLA